MKKYKLLKWYPGLPKDWEEGIIVVEHKNFFIRANKDLTTTYLYRDNVVNCDEFWLKIDVEELAVPIGTKFKVSDETVYTIKSVNLESGVYVHWNEGATYYPIKCANMFINNGSWKIYKERTYEIISMISNDGNIKNIDVFLSTVEELLSHYDRVWNIYSVKRLVDNEIFTIDDRISLQNKYSNHTIRSFSIIDNHVVASINDSIDLKFRSGKGCNINILKHSKVLFTTEDGIDIYEGESCYAVFELKLMPSEKYFGNNYRYIYFKTVKAADDYIRKNTPCLSYNDIANHISTIQSTVLLNLVNERL